jgi:hypothetical protein
MFEIQWGYITKGIRSSYHLQGQLPRKVSTDHSRSHSNFFFCALGPVFELCHSCLRSLQEKTYFRSEEKRGEVKKG